jgi:hypothetical protein
MPDYLITKDIPQLLQNRHGLKLTDAEIEALNGLQDEFIARIKPYLSEDQKLRVIENVAVDTRSVARPLFLDDVHFRTTGESLSFTRSLPLEDLANNSRSKRISPRHGALSLDEQMERLEHKDYTLVDVGIFTGETVVKLVDDLREHGITANKAVVAVCNKNYLDCGGGKNYLKEELADGSKRTTGIEVVVPDSGIFNFGEWMELRDIVGFDGRSVRSEGRTFAAYITNLAEHASIKPKNCDLVGKISETYFERMLGVLRQRDLQLSFEDTRVNQRNQMHLLRTIHYMSEEDRLKQYESERSDHNGNN